MKKKPVDRVFSKIRIPVEVEIYFVKDKCFLHFDSSLVRTRLMIKVRKEFSNVVCFDDAKKQRT